MARQVWRDDVALGGQAVEHGMPHLERLPVPWTRTSGSPRPRRS